jgi:hypothetical protein
MFMMLMMTPEMVRKNMFARTIMERTWSLNQPFSFFSVYFVYGSSQRYLSPLLEYQRGSQ